MLNQDILVVGGYTGGARLDVTEIISIHDGTNTMAPYNLNTARSGFGLIALGGGSKKLLAFGGSGNGVDNKLDSIEEWQEATQKWKMTDYALSEKKSEFGYLTVPPSVVCPN